MQPQCGYRYVISTHMVAGWLLDSGGVVCCRVLLGWESEKGGSAWLCLEVGLC